jgi:hypothetical protein
LRMAASSETARRRNSGYLSYLIENISCLINASRIFDEFSVITDLNSSGWNGIPSNKKINLIIMRCQWVVVKLGAIEGICCRSIDYN